jgi:hypothetical protein
MATATMPRAGELKLEYGQAEIIAVKFIEGRSYAGSFGPRVMFTLTDERKLWLDAEDGSDLERSLRELGIAAGEEFRLTKIRQPRGGGHSLRVEAIEVQPPAWVTEPQPRQALQPVPQQQPERAFTESAAKMAGAFMSAVDAMSEAQAYANRRGVPVSFTSEDLRAVALSIYIGEQRGGAR